jgi:hypothetical protein
MVIADKTSKKFNVDKNDKILCILVGIKMIKKKTVYETKMQRRICLPQRRKKKRGR